MKKPVVLFPYVEAGMGHVAPMRALAKKFKEMYGDIVDCVETKFYADSGDPVLTTFERKMCKSVVDSNKNRALGFFITANMNFWGTRIATHCAACCLQAGTAKRAKKRMDDFAPDLVFSTHWSTHYFAKKCSVDPLTAIYVPDAGLYPLFDYPGDLALVPTRAGYEEALKKKKRRYNPANLKCVPTLIGDEAFAVSQDKRALRKKLGLDADKFTVILVEGGYGIGKMTAICRKIIARDLPVNLIPVCGKNEELHREMLSWKTGENCNFVPLGFIDNMAEYMSASDLFCGKSGANVFAEACFFGVPQIVTKYASGIEKMNGRYYVEKIKTALKIFNADKVVRKIEEFVADPAKLEPLRQAAANQRANYGAEDTAKLIFNLLCTRFPELKDKATD